MAQEKEEKTLRDSIAAASIVRAQGDALPALLAPLFGVVRCQYNSNGTCLWPDCAPVCEARQLSEAFACFLGVWKSRTATRKPWAAA